MHLRILYLLNFMGCSTTMPGQLISYLVQSCDHSDGYKVFNRGLIAQVLSLRRGPQLCM